MEGNLNYSFLYFPDFRDKALTLSYDDGAKYDEKLVEIFNKYGLKATFNLCSGKLLGNNRWYLSSDEAKALYKNGGHEIAVHGVNHICLPEVPLNVAMQEISEDRRNLEKIFNTVVRGMAYAYGSVNEKIIDIVKSVGMVYARTTDSSEKFIMPNNWLALSPTCHHNNPRLDELVNMFLTNEENLYNIHSFWKGGPKLFYLWGHSHEFGKDNNWDRIVNFAKKMSNREDVWYATNIEIYEYVEAYKNLVWSCDGKCVYNPWNKQMFLKYYDEKIVLKAGETKIL